MSDLGNKQIMAENIQRLMDEHGVTHTVQTHGISNGRFA